MTYDFGRMNGASFERLARALAFKHFGTSGVVFSSGADGARDFTIEGKIRGYESKSWDGYLVLQSKYKEHQGQRDDVDWLIGQINAEYQKYANPDNGLRAPEYYVVVTNVRLSGADGLANKKTGKTRTGGYTKVSNVLDTWKEIGVKGWDIWHADKLVDLLNDASEVRQSFAAWVTPGDILAKILHDTKTLRPEFKQTIGRAIRVSLHRDQFARLKDAGSVNDDQIRTSQVFIDLPLPTPRNSDQSMAKFVVSSLIDRAKEKLDPDSLDKDASIRGSGQSQDRNKIVLVGGPGQGKSTATLFLTQIFRAALVDKDPATRRDHNLKKLVPEVLYRAASERINADVPHRYPLSISLPRFADAISLARKETRALPSLLTFIAQELAVVSDGDVSRADIREWLGLHPWLLVLDGLDEVPSTGERPALIKAINSFFSEVAEANADILTIVTTRPQGYNKDLDPEIWEHWRLAELSVKQALDYAKGFGEARYRDDKHRRSELLSQLSAASKQPATARLMTSPLQVTILHFIVDTGGGVPAARWTLFNEYFEVLKRRERAKGGETQRVLEHHWNQLGPLHHRIGLILQSDSEHGGGAGGKLSHDRLKGIVRSYLQSEGFAEDDLNARVDELMSLALHRLVLLSTQEEGQVQFDVRSLQEFMAAAALTSGDQNLMESRLAHIAGKTHWQHVFLIAASRCFADDAFHYRRTAIVSIARQLDASEPDIVVRNGARLAVELLADGIGSDHPISRRQLLLHSLDTLQLGEDMIDEKLYSLWDEATLDILHRKTEELLKLNGPGARATWLLLISVAKEHPTWTMGLIRSHWPENPVEALQILDSSTLPWHPEIDALAVEALMRAGPSAVRQLPQLRSQANRFREKGSAFASLLWRLFEERNALNASVFLADGGFHIKISRIHQEKNVPEIDSDGAKDWRVVRLASEFSQNPGKDLLSRILVEIADGYFETAKLLINRLPWPLASILHEADTAEELKDWSDRVALGHIGDGTDWSRAERRWQKVGIVEQDLLELRKGVWFSHDVAQVGCPPFWTYSVSPNSNNVHVADMFSAISHEVSRTKDADILLGAAMFALRGSLSEDIHDEDLVRRLFDIAVGKGRGKYGSLSSLVHIAAHDSARCGNLALLLPEIHIVNLREGSFSVWKDVLDGNPGCRPILRAIAATLVECDTEAELEVALRQLDSYAFIHQAGDADGVSEAVAVIRLMSGLNDNIETDVEAILSAHLKLECGSLFMAALQSDYINPSLAAKVLIKFIKALEDASEDVPALVLQQLRKALDSRRSEFTDQATWISSFRLPEDAYEFLLPLPSNTDLRRI
ncbi:NACHT domain-containing protein [Devosia sp. SL43]|uniref:NACHT domain-containing protein n=1 Tax=Devosia sp. SL43 TaxID=2806348 RepID=UPI001F3E5236|nr:hypothetical protein [Devosia sp. SL43]UJW85105.1 hypothetical protein IM737_17100 [Devosia sp. SL43]